MQLTDLLPGVRDIAIRAGAEIMKVYQREDLGVQTKQDDSPLTQADLAAHDVIVQGLAKLYPGTPILSEEDANIAWETRSSWDRYWLVDPLDGTKEFINRNGEFTVNIALIENQRAVLGVVYVPPTKVCYSGILGQGATVERDGVSVKMASRAFEPVQGIIAVASRRHRGEQLQHCLDRLSALGPLTDTSMGSSLKLCLVAEGKADIYPRLAPTCEWDTAAAQAVVEAAGGQVLDADFKPLRYNTTSELLNPWFYVVGDPAIDWKQLLSQ
ncbi:3'(2'),5'-bisphosphate nucleotidase CysQ [Aestuariirhabdus sp. Z084]|uniref:3'(2'),5'-bisphosphate nucleotidase CysQ n=1 Tax=Aestuariirhabdus haliotis TaxID=2918751 RepID=UPI00201B3EAC|nr:3'(2'),5'-bisphosphate nucleotidase CysQ [Aestuariirhabdus haliotis]MCL6414393.1 3'(2'),5'-bisphosphate nucleotidase CysQ [Aestuariirhabdus haliotis]MCL6418325.1 3'(2'),5'-bisphosphate nucleotidase CysQ [Aestuariirhabdus haliotis]